MKKLILIAFVVGMIAPQAIGQIYTFDSKTSKLEVLGTSSLHDWELKAEDMSGKTTIKVDDAQMEITSLTFVVPVESLKSDHNAMDDNTYEALKSESCPTISYKLKDMEVIEKNGEEYTLKTSGDLTIAGFTKTINMTVKSTKSNNSVSFMGKVDFKMTDFKIDPPTAIFGTVKTGDQVTIQFNVKYNL
jgi:polyisoprenoid-binding protein YceI